MGNGYIGSRDIRAMEKLMRSMCQRKGYDFDTAFKGLIDFILWQFDVEQLELGTEGERKPPEGWRFDSEDADMFCDMMMEYLKLMESVSQNGMWYDAFGDLYMSLHSGGGGKGQFFTPDAVCNALATVELSDYDKEYLKNPPNKTSFGKRIVINDAACGSSRLLLAADVALREKMRAVTDWPEALIMARRPYLCGEDLDFNCVKMSAINMMMHGCYGEVVCHDSLIEPEAVRLAYIVNETMWPFPTGIPCIRRVSDPKRLYIARHWIERRRQQEQKCVKHNEPKKVSTEPKQLTLW